jgi:hypothetical protein
MKRRIRTTINFLGTTLLIFVIYLNFFYQNRIQPPFDSDMKRPAFGDSVNKKLPVKSDETPAIQLQGNTSKGDQLEPFSRKH